MGDPLRGRKDILKMYPISQLELKVIEKSGSEPKAHLETRKIFFVLSLGSNEKSEEIRKENLHDLFSSLYKRYFGVLKGILKSKKLVDLLLFLDFQNGREMPYLELATQLSIGLRNC